MTPAVLEQLFWIIAASAASIIAILVWSVVLVETVRQRRRPRISDAEIERIAAAAQRLRTDYYEGGQL